MGKIKLRHMVDERTDEHEARANFCRGVFVELAHRKLLRRNNFQRVLFDPCYFYADALHDFDQTVHLFNVRDTMKCRLAFVDERCTQKNDGAVLGEIGSDGARKLPSTCHLKIE